MTPFHELSLELRVAWLQALKDDKVLDFTIKKGSIWIPGSKRDTKGEPEFFESQFRDAWGRDYKAHEDYVPGEAVIETLLADIAAAAERRAGDFTPYHTLLDFVLAYMDREQVTLTDRDSLEKENRLGLRNPITVPAFTVGLEVAGDNYNRSIPPGPDGKGLLVRPLSTDKLGKAFDDWRAKQHRQRIDVMQESIWYDQSLAAGLEAAVQELLSCYWIEKPLDVVMFKHLLWSIKRRVYNRDIPYEVFYSFYSREGGIGKSKLMRDLAPIPNIYAQGDLASLANEHNYFALVAGRNLINFDELHLPDSMGGEQDRMAANALSLLKRIITEEDITVRKFNTQASMTQKKGTVLVSTSNFPLYEMICDSTGMRRFWSFESDAPNGAAELRRFEDAFKYLKNIQALYRMVNEDDDEGFFHPNKPWFQEIAAVQQSYARQDQITKFLADKKWQFCDRRDPQAVPQEMTRFFNSIRAWRKNRGDYPQGSLTLEALIKTSHGEAPFWQKKDNKHYYYVKPVQEEVEAAS